MPEPRVRNYHSSPDPVEHCVSRQSGGPLMKSIRWVRRMPPFHSHKQMECLENTVGMRIQWPRVMILFRAGNHRYMKISLHEPNITF